MDHHCLMSLSQPYHQHVYLETLMQEQSSSRRSYIYLVCEQVFETKQIFIRLFTDLFFSTFQAHLLQLIWKKVL
jgi:hypothetical protein